MPTAIAQRRATSKFASPILMEQVIRRFRPTDNLRQSLRDAGASDEMLANIVVVIPGAALDSFRFAYLGEEVFVRIGRDLTGRTFGEVLEFGPHLVNCLAEFKYSCDNSEKVISRHRYDFSDKWLIEYSKIIYPCENSAEEIYIVAFYSFHDSNVNGSFF